MRKIIATITLAAGAAILGGCMNSPIPLIPRPAHTQASVPSSPVRFRYDSPSAAAYALVKPGDVVVVGPRPTEASDRLAVSLIHAKNAQALRYVQWYWHPNGRSYQGNDIAAQPGGAFCSNGNAPLVDTAGHPGQTWTYMDLNERAVRNAQTAYLTYLRGLGYDGIFVDRGTIELQGARAQSRSACTADPVVPGRTMAQAFVGMLGQARAAGLTVALNGGSLPGLNARPAGVDAMRLSRYVLNENAPQGGATALRADAAVGAKWGLTAWALVRPGTPGATGRLTTAAQVPAVRIVHGVRAPEDRP